MENKYIIGISIDKVQTYLTRAITSHTKEKETEAGTLKEIMNASKDISEGFFKIIERKFSGYNLKGLIFCSGVCICETTISEEDIKSRLKKLFKHYYKTSNGTKLLRYTFFCKQKLDSFAAIKKAKLELKKNDCLNKVITANKELLFNFSAPCKKDVKKSLSSVFADNIDELFIGENAEDKTHFRIAVIKADLDGMGKYFEDIKSYDEYKKVSAVLSQKISFEGLQAAVACKNYKNKKWVFPFYAAGDDIFFAVEISNLMNGISVCQKMLENINKNIKDSDLSLSIGVAITFNREPIRYYFEMAEEQLSIAKKTKLKHESLSKFLKIKIAIGGICFFETLSENIFEKYNDLNSRIYFLPIWQEFCNNLKLLLWLRENNDYRNYLGTVSSLYSILERISNMKIQRSKQKYLNTLLYTLLPKYLDNKRNSLWKAEIILNASIFKQLWKKDDKGPHINYKEWNMAKKHLNIYLRLLILFCDVRFSIAEILKINTGNMAVLGNERVLAASKILMTNVHNHLYDNYLKDNVLCKFFVDRLTDVNKISYFQTVNIEKSMFFKLRNIDKYSIDKASEIISLVNRPDKEEHDKKSTKDNNSGKHIYKMTFDKEMFAKTAEANSSDWNPDFINSLMLFYQYNEVFIKYRTLMHNGDIKKLNRNKKYNNGGQNGKNNKIQNHNRVQPIYRRCSNSF